ncbi:MAG: TIGR01620 family protein [Thalassovita sp.]
MNNGPILIDLDENDAAPGPENAPVVPDIGGPQGQAVQRAAQVASYRPSRLGRWILGLAITFVGAVASIAAWDFVVGLISRSPILGMFVSGIAIALLIVLSLVMIKELAALSRLSRIDKLQGQADQALAEADLEKARRVSTGLVRLYRQRADLDWGRARFEEQQLEPLDASALLVLAETELLTPLDKAAEAEVQAAARQVATVTALVPLAFADVLTALTANIRMIRRISEIYGGRAGAFGSWRMTRAVMTHLVATGAVALGDDMLGSFAGGGVLSKLSRRFGEGVVNGALTVRVGVAAMEVCRPLPYVQARRPSVSGLVTGALTGLFTKS